MVLPLNPIYLVGLIVMVALIFLVDWPAFFRKHWKAIIVALILVSPVMLYLSGLYAYIPQTRSLAARFHVAAPILAVPPIKINPPDADHAYHVEIVSVKSAKELPAWSGLVKQAAKGTFVVVTTSITNDGKWPASFSNCSYNLVDARGRIFSPVGSPFSNGGGEINPGLSFDASVAFDVSVTDGLWFVVHSGSADSGVIVPLPPPEQS